MGTAVAKRHVAVTVAPLTMAEWSQRHHRGEAILSNSIHERLDSWTATYARLNYVLDGEQLYRHKVSV